MDWPKQKQEAIITEERVYPDNINYVQLQLQLELFNDYLKSILGCPIWADVEDLLAFTGVHICALSLSLSLSLSLYIYIYIYIYINGCLKLSSPNLYHLVCYKTTFAGCVPFERDGLW